MTMHATGEAPALDAFGAMASALVALARDDEAARARHWLLLLDDGISVSVSADVGWMQWVADAPGAPRAIAPRSGAPAPVFRAAWLERQAALPLTLKYWERPGLDTLAVRCEWPLVDGMDVVGRVDELRRAFLAAQGRAAGEQISAVPSPRADAGMPPDQLVALCVEAGWTATSCPDGARVPVGGARSAFDATVALTASGGVRARVDLLRDAELAAAGAVVAAREATAQVLLEAGRRVRFARPFMTRSNDGLLAIGFEVDLGAAPAAAELAHALGALDAACALCGPEVVVLCSTDLAARIESLSIANPDASPGEHPLPARPEVPLTPGAP